MPRIRVQSRSRHLIQVIQPNNVKMILMLQSEGIDRESYFSDVVGTSLKTHVIHARVLEYGYIQVCVRVLVGC
jgi:hypothetical protein